MPDDPTPDDAPKAEPPKAPKPKAPKAQPAQVYVHVSAGAHVFRSRVDRVPDITREPVPLDAAALSEVLQAARSAGVTLQVKES